MTSEVREDGRNPGAIGDFALRLIAARHDEPGLFP